MKLMKMELENFRQYYGKQSIEFAYQGNQNTTILFGENGKGKTGIYRAIMFVLFGSKKISQDASNENIHLTNFKIIDDTSGPAESSVTLKFEHENEVYEIKRSMRAIKISSNSIKEQEGEVSLIEIDANTGNVKPNSLYDKQEINIKINKIINEEIKDFFLFDAEKIDTIAKADSNVRKEVKDAIFSLLQLDKIETAKTFVKDISKVVRFRLTEGMKNGNANQLSQKISDIDLESEEIKSMIFKLDEDKQTMDEIIAQHSLTLEKNKHIVETKNKIQEKENQINLLKNQLENSKVQLSRSLFEQSPSLILEGVLDENKSYFDNFLGDNKVSIPKEILNLSLLNEKCIVCDNDLKSHEQNKKYIESLLETYKHSESYDLARNLLKEAKDKLDEYTKSEQDFINNLKNYKNLSNEISKGQDAIKDLKDDISKSAKNSVDLADIQGMIEQEERKKESAIREIALKENKLEELEKQKEELENQYQEILKKESRNEFDQAQLQTLVGLEHELKDISKSFSEEVRSLLGEYTSDIFKKLIDKKDLEVISYVEIDGHFQIGAFNNNGYKITQDISQGQRQILSLSFITALAKIAVREDSVDKIDYPLFMDSPFNRLSGMNRDNLIEKIPDLTAQWILLVTDTELTPSEEKVFKSTNRLGKWYRINQIDIHHSEIEAVDLNETMSTRGGF
ncbi:AAA family ATPase [Staphylococcus arlettae]|uniref:AAA family ATPase n=1 Tax=Staphylococcus arlettae TaxID=29378 RepID=UPI002DB8B87E|nr:AAA family ATPase [Staphylococcus arlettae]MEB7421531.1 AAA family ATPase [Staphylococcus arlettae]